MNTSQLAVIIALSIPCAAQSVTDTQPSGPIAQQPLATTQTRPAQPVAPPQRVTLPAGTQVLLALKSPITTKSALPGSPVYAQTTFPVTVDGKMVIPPGSYVQGVVDSIRRPGHIKGRAQLSMHFTTLIYPSGYTVQLPGSLSGAPAGETEKVDKEGKITENGSKGKDAVTVLEGAGSGAGLGAGVGAATGHIGEGLGIGTAAGAAAGLGAVLFSRGNDIRFDAGTPITMELQRPLVLEEERVSNQPVMFQQVQSVNTLPKSNQSNTPRMPGVPLPYPY